MIRGMFSLVTLTLFGVLYLCPNDIAYALSDGPSHPEAMQFEPVDASDVVSLVTGNFVYNLPLLVVPGPAGDYPINLSYHSGIGPNQEATWVGLGWTLNPGAVNRTVSGYPDDYKGDYVQTHFEAEPESGWRGNIGVGIGYGYGSIGVNMNYDSYSSQFGINYYSKIGYSQGPFNASAGLSLGTGGLSTQAGVGVDYDGFGAGVNVNASSQGVVGLNVGAYAPGNSSVGYSFSNKGNRANYSFAGLSPNFVSESSERRFDSQGFDFSIPVYYLTINLGYSHWLWTLDEEYFEKSYGYLHQNGYLTDATDTTEKKFERQKHGRFLYASQDAYQVSAQGLAGLFKPFARNYYTMTDWSANDQKAALNNLGVINNYPGNVVFRFLGDPGANFITQVGSGQLNRYHNIFPDRLASKQIVPTFTAGGKISKFRIVDVDGTEYIFSHVIKNYTQYSWSVNNKTNFESYNMMATPYATNWLLTEIRGPDFVDRDNNGISSDGDWGYWVKFIYKDDPRPFVWRSPIEGMAPGTASEDIESASFGVKSMAFLERIETASHFALFRKSERKDRRTANLQYNKDIILHARNTHVNTFNIVQTPTIRFQYSGEMDFLGNWEFFFDALPPATEVIRLKEVITFIEPRLDDPNRLQYSEVIRDKVLKKSDLSKYSLLNDVTHFEYEDSFIGQAELLPGGTFRHRIVEAELLISNIIPPSYSVAKKLDRIDLYSKADPEVSKQSDGWTASDQATSLKSVIFTYDYSLSPGTPDSSATVADGSGAGGGKLTLKSVEQQGRNGDLRIPSYEFVYGYGSQAGEKYNPNYYLNGWDKWGSYRYPVIDGIYVPLGNRYEHDTLQNQQEADYAAAWSLTQILTPTGGTISVEYESDDYYYVNDFIDLNEIGEIVKNNPDYPAKLELHALGPVTVGSDYNTIEIPRLAIPAGVEFKEGKYLSLFEAYEPNSRPYARELKVLVRKITNVTSSQQSFIVQLDGDPINFRTNNVHYSYYVRPFKPKVYGGGIRVKSISTFDGSQRYKTAYRYEDEDGFSSGTTATVPSSFGEFNIMERQRDRDHGPGWLIVSFEDWQKFRTLHLDHDYSYGRPAPNVIYSRVEVINVDQSNKPLNGKTVYQFFTSKDHPYNPEDNPQTNVLSIFDRSGIYGTIKSVAHFEQDEQLKFRKVRESQSTFAFSERLHQSSRIFTNWDDKIVNTNTSNDLSNGDKPLGLIKETFGFYDHKGTDRAPNQLRRRVERYYPNIYNIGNHTTDSYYDSPSAGGLPKTVTSVTRNFIWDALTGQPVANATLTSKSEAVIRQAIPAYWVNEYQGMKQKNMLTQIAQEITHLGNVDLLAEGDILDYTFHPDDIIGANVITWRNWGNNTWRKNDTYVYTREIDRTDGRYSPFNDWNYAFATYPLVSTDKPWRMTSNITKYNEYSYPVEESHIDRTYSSAVYGYSGALPVTVARNASLNEIYYLNFETEGGLNTLGTVSAYFTGYGEGRTGKAFKAFASAGPWYNLDGLKRQKIYLVSFWAKKGTADPSHKICFYFSGPGMAGTGVPVFKTLQTDDRWEYFEFKFVPLDNGTVEMHLDLDNVPGTGGKWHYVDDLRIHPIDATMSTFAYDPLTLQVTSITDENNIAAYFEYDGYGRLVRVRDQDRNLLSKYAYHYGQEILVPRGRSFPGRLRDRFSRSFPMDRLGGGSGSGSLRFDLILGNYIKRQSILTPITSESDIGRLADHELMQTIDYYSGLAKAAQSIVIKGSPSKKDVVTPVKYNELGLQTKPYLPYAADSNTGEYRPGDLNEQKAFYQSALNVPHTEYPFAETVHEKSPLLRVKEQGYAGEPWQPAGRAPASGHTLKTKYRTNDANEVRLWKWNGTASRFQADGFYDAGQLAVTEIENENGNPAVEYKDKSDRVVLKRVLNRDKNNHLIRLDTYYIYDDLGNLRFIVPPRAVFGMLNSGAWFIDRVRDSKWVTEYVYDGYHRIIEKKVPGAEPVYTVYDGLGRPVLTQDGKLRRMNRWLFTKYDILGRPVMTGIYHDAIRTSRPAMQSYLDTYVNNVNTFFYEKRTEVGASSFSMDALLSNQGYSNQAFPPLGPASQLLTVTYYDDYDFNNNGRSDDDYSYVPDAEFSNNKAFYRLKNKVTGRRVRVLKDFSTTPNLPNWITDVIFYDKYGRVIQEYTRDHKGITVVNTEYDFPGKVLKTKRVHTSTDGVIVRKRYEYDHAGRLSKVYQRNNNDPEVLLKENKYNELGVLIEKNLHSEDNGNTFLQSVDFQYSIRGWLTRLNDIGSIGGSQPGDANKDLFAMRLRYDKVDSTRLENMPQYNGNISAIDWGVPPPVVTLAGGVALPPDPDIHSYAFKYDQINQLTEAEYRHRTFGNLPLDGDRQYNVFAAYDPNGNIESVKRYGVTGGTRVRGFLYGLVDDLAYYYHGNQLTGVDARVPNGYGYDFYDKNRIGMNAGQAEYIYDTNGNMIEDKNKGITVSYNHLNLPTVVDFGNGNKIEWLYSAAGEKLRKTVYNGGSIAKTIDYVGGIVYEGDTIDFFATDEGRVKRLENGSLRYEYNLTDHLGNVRLSFTKGANGTTPEVLQEDHYYPFGMKLKGLSKVESGQKENKFTYNGKELEDDHGLNWHHYGARYYDPQLGRWHTMDPVNQYYSPYVYVGNNPVLFLDPDGQEPGSPFDDPERILRDQVEKGYLPAEHGEAMIQGYNRGLQIAAIVGTAALAVYGAVLYGPELFYAVSTWFLSNPQRAENVVETAIDIAADSYRPDPGDVLEVTGKKGLNTSIEISESLAENFTGNELNWFIGKQQRELIKEFFGQGLEGALKRKENFEVPKDLTRESLEAYRAAALKIMQEVKDNPNVQAVQRARIELIDRALKEIE